MAYRSAFTEADLIEGNVSVVTGSFIKLGEYKVEAGERIATGYGGHTGQDQAEGRIHLDLETDVADTKINGVVRLMAVSPQDHPLEVLSEFRSETLRTNINDRSLQIAFPEHSSMLSEDIKLGLYFKPDTNGTVSQTNTDLIMDITRYRTK